MRLAYGGMKRLYRYRIDAATDLADQSRDLDRLFHQHPDARVRIASRMTRRWSLIAGAIAVRFEEAVVLGVDDPVTLAAATSPLAQTGIPIDQTLVIAGLLGIGGIVTLGAARRRSATK